MAEQMDVIDMGGTMRLGACPAMLEEGSVVAGLYGTTVVSERHRHRYEFNSRYREQFEAPGMRCSGTSPDGRLVDSSRSIRHSLLRRAPRRTPSSNRVPIDLTRCSSG